MDLDHDTGGRTGRIWSEHFSSFLVFSLYVIHCCFCERRILSHLIGYLQQAACDESDSLQLVYGDLIGCCSSLQTPPELLIGYLSRKHAVQLTLLKLNKHIAPCRHGCDTYIHIHRL